MPDMADLLPHAPPMVLLDEVVEKTDRGITTSLLIAKDAAFIQAGHGVPSYVGIEYMAQTCGAYAGLEALAQNRPIRLGYLLGTRNFQARVDWFVPGQRLLVRARELMRHEFMGVFECSIETHDNAPREVIATAWLNLYQPEPPP